MRKTLLLASLFLGILHSQAQEQVMNIWKTDGTSTQTRVADLKQISFLRVDGANQGMQVKTLGGETVAVLFETERLTRQSPWRSLTKHQRYLTDCHLSLLPLPHGT